MKEKDIRPQKLLDRYVELSSRDADSCFGSKDRFDLPCVGCGAENSTAEFVKSGFQYVRCLECGSLYQSPRPTIESFERFYQNSESSRYWAEVFFPAVAEVRREKIFQPRVEMLSDLCADRQLNVEKVVEIGAGYGIFLEEWMKKFPSAQAIAIEPSEFLASECRRKGLKVIESIAENVTGMEGFADLVVCFEVLEHVYNPLAFLEVLKAMVRPGGYVFISTLSIDGFDLQILWEKSKQISPPHHINFFSVNGFQRLFDRAGLIDVDVMTPGKLDVDIVLNSANEDSEILKNERFLQVLLDNPETAKAFQTFLSNNRLSSHAWVISQKPEHKEI